MEVKVIKAYRLVLQIIDLLYLIGIYTGRELLHVYDHNENTWQFNIDRAYMTVVKNKYNGYHIALGF